MAYNILLHFDDEEAALSFVEDLEENQDKPHMQTVPGGKVTAIYKAPTMFCEGHGGKKTALGFTMGMKWGWWVCATCKKPSKLYWQNIVEKQSSFGKNIYTQLFTED